MVAASAKMPYYCTVPRCTSMAGKAKNVSFHQFPRDEELAKLWNRILKRGKPYTKYSKVCSLHFKPEDYTITSVGKNKGQWRTLRKDAVPSQNLPSESPVPYTRRNTGCWMANTAQPSLVDPVVQQQMAQAIYMQTMLAMQAAGASEPMASNDEPLQMPEPFKPSPSGSSISEIEHLLKKDTEQTPKEVTYKCQECSKCFKDPDVFILHKRTHKHDTTNTEKENYSTNIQDRDETLRANPILANLLKTSMRLEPESSISNILTVENQIMTALASNMEAYIRTLTSMLSSQGNATESEDKCEDKSDCSENYNETDDKYEDSNNLRKDDADDCEKENDMLRDGECVDTNEDVPMDQDENDLSEINNDDTKHEISEENLDKCNTEDEIYENRNGSPIDKSERLDDNYTKDSYEPCNDKCDDESQMNLSDDKSNSDTKRDEYKAENDINVINKRDNHNFPINVTIEYESTEEYEQKNDTCENHTEGDDNLDDTNSEMCANDKLENEKYTSDGKDDKPAKDNADDNNVYDGKFDEYNPDCDSIVDKVVLNT